MAITPTIGVVILINNYFHDISTAMLASSGAALWFIINKYEHHENPHTKEYFLEIYDSMSRVAKYSLLWLLIGGVPRTLAYRDFEWSNAVDHKQIPALIVKHILEFTLVASGVYLWIKVNGRVNNIKARPEPDKANL